MRFDSAIQQRKDDAHDADAELLALIERASQDEQALAEANAELERITEIQGRALNAASKSRFDLRQAFKERGVTL